MEKEDKFFFTVKEELIGAGYKTGGYCNPGIAYGMKADQIVKEGVLLEDVNRIKNHYQVSFNL